MAESLMTTDRRPMVYDARSHAQAYLDLHAAEKAAEAARGLLQRCENASRVFERKTVTVVLGGKAITLLPPKGGRGGETWAYIISDVAS